MLGPKVSNYITGEKNKKKINASTLVMVKIVPLTTFGIKRLHLILLSFETHIYSCCVRGGGGALNYHKSHFLF